MRTLTRSSLHRLGSWLGAVSLLAALPLAAQAASPASESWYVVSIAGQPVGSVHERTAAAEGGVQVSDELHLVLNRLGSKVEMSMGASSRETADGRLLGLETTMRLSTQTTSSSLTVEGSELRIRDRAGDRSFERTVPFTGELVGAEGLRLRSLAGLRKPGDRIEAQTYVAELNAVRKVTRTALGEETVATPGGPVPALKVEEATEGSPAPRTLWLDREGRLVQSAEAGPFGEMRSVRTDEAAARRAEAGGELPEEMYARTLVKTPVRIPHPRRAERLVLRLRHRSPDLGWPAFDGPGQKVLEKSREALTLEITRVHPRARQPFPLPAPAAPAAATAKKTTEETAPFLAPNAYIQSDDPAIRAAALSAVAGAGDVLAAGLKLQRWVTANMQFDLGIVFAPSTEIFANRRGTCAGYAMLLTTMARAAGIPARYVLGYVYVDGIFGGHAWTEIKVGDEWVPLDAAIPADGPADAGHLAFLHSSLADGVSALTAGPALQMFGQIDADILAVTVAGRPAWTVPAGARLYTVAGDRYRNTGLGIALEEPPGFRFTGLDAVWPESRLVGMEGPGGARVELRLAGIKPGEEAEAAAWERLDGLVPGGRHGRTKAAGRPAWSDEAAAKAALAWQDGEDLWLLAAEGPDAPALLRRVAATVELPE